MSKFYSFLLASCLLLMACSHNARPIGKPLPQLSFEHLKPYAIQGGAVRIQQSFVEHPQSKALSAKFPIAPDKLLQRYAAKRFVTRQTAQQGAQERLVFDIKDASVSKINDPEGLISFFAGTAVDYYTLNMLVAMTPIRRDGQRAAPFTVKFNRRLSLPHNLSLAEREFRQFEFLEKAISDIDQSITQIVQHKMTAQYF